MSTDTLDPVIMRRVQRAAETHYTPSRVGFLELLDAMGEDGRNVSQLSAEFSLSRATIRAMADALVAIRAARIQRGPGHSTIYRANLDDLEVIFS